MTNKEIVEYVMTTVDRECKCTGLAVTNLKYTCTGCLVNALKEEIVRLRKETVSESDESNKDSGSLETTSPPMTSIRD